MRRIAGCVAALLVVAAADDAGGAENGPPDIPQMVVHPHDDPQWLLLARGDFALMLGDIVAARRFFIGVAETGNAQAARRLAQTYDPVWLVRNDVTPWESFADAEKAYRWYRQAAEAGDTSPDNRYRSATR